MHMTVTFNHLSRKDTVHHINSITVLVIACSKRRQITFSPEKTHAMMNVTPGSPRTHPGSDDEQQDPRLRQETRPPSHVPA